MGPFAGVERPMWGRRGAPDRAHGGCSHGIRWACGGVMVFPVAVAGKQVGPAGMGIFLVARSSRCVAAGKGLRTSH